MSSLDLNSYEEEMMRLASEISMVENLYDADDLDDELDWNPQNLTETEETIRLFEEIVDEHMVCSENANYIESSEEEEGFGEPNMTHAEAREAFLMGGNANDYDSHSIRSAASSYSDTFSPRSTFGLKPDTSVPSRNSVSTRKEHLNRRPSGRGRDQRIKDTVTTISGKLRWYQNKIAQTIESTNENDSLAHLLELNDRVSSLFSKTEEVIHRQSNSSFSTRNSETTPTNMSVELGNRGSGIGREAKQFAKVTPHDESLRLTDIAPIVYALSRGSNRAQTLGTVNKLIALCNFGGDVRLAAVKEMMAAGALQSLLSTLARAGDWPEVELQISKVISVLVTYEDDWALLQRSAYVILSSLYTLQLKSNARITETIIKDNERKRRNSEPFIMENEDGVTLDEGGASQKRRNDQDEIYEQMNIALCEDQAQDVRALVSAAIAKLTLVLSCDWNALESPTAIFGGPFGNNTKSNKSTNPTVQSNINQIHLIRNISGGSGNMKQEQSGGNRARSQSNADSMKILEILLNLIVTMSESSLQAIHASASNESQIQANSKLNTKDSFDSLFSMQSKSNSSLNLSVSTTPGISSTTTTTGIALPAPARIGTSVSFSNINETSGGVPTELKTSNPLLISHKMLSGVGLANNTSISSIPQSDTSSLRNDAFDKPLIQVDNATVLCSAALSNLAEITQCRPDLVTGGALKIIKSWLEIGIEVLAHARRVCFQDPLPTSPSIDSVSSETSSMKKERRVCAQFVDFMKTYGTAYELISNAAAAIMYLSGGYDVRFSQNRINHRYYTGSGSNPLEFNGGRDYVVGWIDAQIIAEGIPAVIVKLITTAVEDFTTVRDLTVATRSVLPAAVGMHLSQTLYQLCSRSQNRQQLKITNIPYALCILFENTVSQVRNITYTQNHKHHGDLEEIHDSIYSCIFEFNGIYFQNTHDTAATYRDWECENTTASHHDIAALYCTSIDDNNMCRLSVNNPRFKESTSSKSNKVDSPAHHRLEGKPKTPGSGGAKSVPKVSTNEKTTGGGNKINADSGTPRNDHHATINNSTVSIVMSSIASSCLDALTYFFSDEVAKLPYTASSTRLRASSSMSTLAPPIASPFNSLNSSLSNSGHTQLTQPLIDLMCTPRIVDAILLASSYLPRGQGRLATIRIISSLTEFPQSLKALYEGSVVDVLVLISSESDEIKTAPNANNKSNIGIGVRDVVRTSSNLTDNNDERVVSGGIAPTRPGTVARDVSNTSNISSMSTSSHNRHKDGFYKLRKTDSLASGSTPRAHTHSSHSTEYDDEDEDSTQTSLAAIAAEETLVVCYCLANLCEANPTYAARMFNSGLFMIMIKLICSSNMEVQRQALRCMSAMCPVISNESIEKAIFVKPKKSNSLFLEALTSLTYALKSPSILVLKGAMKTIAQLALINEQIQDSIVEGPLRSIISLLVNPKNDRETRAAAEEVLKNIGFLGGVKDFELCGFDFEILRDWYAMKRSLKPQEQAYAILKEWIENLFNDAIAGNNDLFNLHHQHNNAELSAHGLANEAVTILTTGSSNITSSNTPTGTNNNSSNALSSVGDRSSIGGNNEKADPKSGLSTPSLHRSITDGIFKFLAVPFCAPRILRTKSGGVGHHSHHNSFHTNSEDSEHTHTRHLSRDEDMAPQGSMMNRSLHPISPSFHSSTMMSVMASNPGAHTPVSEERYDWLDRPPIGVTNLYDLFYSSKLHQMIMMDLTSLGLCIQHPDFADDRSKSENTETMDELDLESVFLMPRPHDVSAILLPSRLYQSFARVGRVLEKMIEYNNTVTMNQITSSNVTSPIEVSPQLWSLTFRESEFDGDFHVSLLSTLRKCPQICSLSFNSSRIMEEDALLGHLVGQIPPSIRFLSFRSTLSKESIQALCILIRTQNAAFIAEATELSREKNRKSSGHFSMTKAGTTGPQKIDISSNKFHASKDVVPGSTRGHSKGLIGLALTHCVFEATEMNHIVELLQLNSKTAVQRAKSFSKYMNMVNRDSNASRRSAGEKNTGDITPTTPLGKNDFLKGLRFIDLSYNSLHDPQAARILQAAMSGPLEGLELCGNAIHKGKLFLEVCDGLLSEKMCVNRVRLRYLGLANNGLSSKMISGLLQILSDNDTVTHLDLSSNEMDHNNATNELLRNFLICNVGMRSLNLCYNKLNMDSFKEIHLGLLENSTMLLLPLAGNPGVDKSGTISLIQIRLRENRLLYKQRCKGPEILNLKDSSMASVSAINLTGERHSISPIDLSDAVLRISDLAEDEGIQMASVVPISPDHSKPTSLTPDATSHSGSKHHLHLTDPNRHALVIALPVNKPGSSISDATKQLNAMNADNNQQKSQKAEVYSRNTNHSGSDVLLETITTPHPATMIPPPVEYSPSAASFTAFTPTNNQPHFGSVTGGISSTINSSLNIPSPTIAGLSVENVKIHNKQQQLSGLQMVTNAMTSNVQPETQTVAQNTLHVLFSAPLAGFDRQLKPHPLEVLDYTAERDILIQVFKEVHRDVSVHFDFATTDSLRTALSFGCKALHFSGHGIPKGLCFEDGRSGLQVIRVPQLKALLGAGGLNLEFVFVSACFSKEIGEAFVKAGVPHVVCVNVDSKIQDAAAIAFTRAFYVAFLSGKTVKDSFDIAKEALKVSPYVPDSVLEGEKFILLPDGTELLDSSNPNAPVLNSNGDLVDSVTGAIIPRPDHNQAIFVNRSVANWPNSGHCTMGPNHTDVSQNILRNKLPSPPADFEGREVVMHSLISSIFDRRLVSLVGEDGVGKTSVASAVCKYIADRKIFADGVVFFRAKGFSDYHSFLKGLVNALLTSSSENVSKKLELLIQNQQKNGGSSQSFQIYPEEELVFSCLEQSRLLLVIDNLDDLLSDYGSNESVTDLRLFLGRLFDQCQHLKILVVSTDTLSMHNVNVGFGIIEYSILLGPLTLNSTLRLFARLAPSLTTAKSKNDFIHALQPAKQLHVSVNCRDVNNTALQILGMFGDGHPAKIVHMACESTPESVEKLKQKGMRIIGKGTSDLNASMLSTSTTATSNNTANSVTSTTTSTLQHQQSGKSV